MSAQHLPICPIIGCYNQVRPDRKDYCTVCWKGIYANETKQRGMTEEQKSLASAAAAARRNDLKHWLWMQQLRDEKFIQAFDAVVAGRIQLYR